MKEVKTQVEYIIELSLLLTYCLGIIVTGGFKGRATNKTILHFVRYLHSQWTKFTALFEFQAIKCGGNFEVEENRPVGLPGHVVKDVHVQQRDDDDIIWVCCSTHLQPASR